jgi:hypothetical protein
MQVLELLSNPLYVNISIREAYKRTVFSQVLSSNVQPANVIKLPGQRYRGKDGYLAAVIKIQSVFRMVKQIRRHGWFLKCKPVARRVTTLMKHKKYIRYLREARAVNTSYLASLHRPSRILQRHDKFVYKAQWDELCKEDKKRLL